MKKIRLGDIATARAGDKGGTSNVAVFVADASNYAEVERQLDAGRVAAAYPELFRGPITRYCVPHLGVLNFVIENGLEGGVNSSLNLDLHGKSFSFLLLDLLIDVPEGEQRAAIREGIQ